MTDQITDDGGNVDYAWADALAGDNVERREALQNFESPQAFADAYFDGLENKSNWRDELAGDDEDFRKQLDRFTEPAAFGKSYQDAQSQLSRGYQPPTLPENATDEDIARFRASHGIPTEVSGYFENLPDGTVVGEEDRALFNDFAESMHEMNVAPEVMHRVIDWYNDFSETMQESQAELDVNDFKETEDSLREAWGNEYRSNINIVGAMLQKNFGDEAAQVLLNARGPDGRALMNTPAIVTGFAQMARDLDPLVTIIPQGGDAAQGLAEEIKQIETFMRTNRTEYMKDEGMQARLRELYEIRAKHEAA